jgi:hypothetical protein
MATPASSSSRKVTTTVNTPATDIKIDEHASVALVKKKASENWVGTTYNINLLTVDELRVIVSLCQYLGYDRDEMLYEIEKILRDPKLVVQAIICLAMRGPQAGSKIKLSNGRSLSEMGIPASGRKGTHDLSCQRILAATADLAAFYLKAINFPKRLNKLACPGWLQFPSAGSIKMPEEMRKLHMEFSKEFSRVIGGVFNEQIYDQMAQNAYLDENLKLFG